MVLRHRVCVVCTVLLPWDGAELLAVGPRHSKWSGVMRCVRGGAPHWRRYTYDVLDAASWSVRHVRIFVLLVLPMSCTYVHHLPCDLARGEGGVNLACAL